MRLLPERTVLEGPQGAEMQPCAAMPTDIVTSPALTKPISAHALQLLPLECGSLECCHKLLHIVRRDLALRSLMERTAVWDVDDHQLWLQRHHTTGFCRDFRHGHDLAELHADVPCFSPNHEGNLWSIFTCRLLLVEESLSNGCHGRFNCLLHCWLTGLTEGNDSGNFIEITGTSLEICHRLGIPWEFDTLGI